MDRIRPYISFQSVILVIIVVLGFWLRLSYFDAEGGDHRIYKKASTEYNKGINPYEYTVTSFKNAKLEKGYAYMPSLLYLQSYLVQLNHFVNHDWPTRYMWKIPVLLADFFIVLGIIKALWKENKTIAIFAVTLWLFNPHILQRKDYVLYDPVAIAPLLWSMLLVRKNSLASGALFALSVTFKTFPVVILPIMLLRSKNILQFMLGGLVMTFLVVLPFMRTFEDFQLMFEGSFLVHGSRGVQGRPILTTIPFYLSKAGINVTFGQQNYQDQFALAAVLVPWFVGLIALFKKHRESIFVLAFFPAVAYYLLTPVLNRTHVLWFFPVLLIGFFQICKKYLSLRVFYVITICVFVGLSGYMRIWDFGLVAYDCSVVTQTPTTQRAAEETCDYRNTFGFSHCPEELGRCVPTCCATPVQN